MGQPLLRRGRVLVVDDESSIRNLLRIFLSAEHDVAAANDGTDALEMIQTGARFDVIVSDVRMPGLNGAELRNAIAQVDRSQADRMLFITYIPGTALDCRTRCGERWCPSSNTSPIG